MLFRSSSRIAFHEVDTHTSPYKQFLMMKLILLYYDKATGALEFGADIEDIVNLPIREKIGRFKYVQEDQVRDEAESIESELVHEITESIEKEGF